jgi:hypothetical protein
MATAIALTVDRENLIGAGGRARQISGSTQPNSVASLGK